MKCDSGHKESSVGLSLSKGANNNGNTSGNHVDMNNVDVSALLKKQQETNLLNMDVVDGVTLVVGITLM